ncbi:hypothetical protein QFC22_004043 [Naganishia vaughanmartiniae]|uniref:Uncharacterized protein n=1 Tax=Naganishia vaughanmartiniae TaxID=1424756 RepID=A0ACC2X431_9TREE|nr:hypothetical protein QFC22_004043 [Naganishia vaughanmartiniae]
MAIPVSSSARTNAGGSAQLRISDPSTANRKTSTRRSKSTASARASSQLLPLCAHPSLRSITNKLTAIQTSRTDTRYSSASQSAIITSESSGNIGNGSGYNSNAALPIQTPKVPKPRPKLSDIPPAHRAVWGKFVKGKVPVPGKVKHEKLCGRCGEKNHGHGNGSGPFGDAFRAVEPAGSKDGRAGSEGPNGPSGKNINQNIITTTTTKTTSKPGNPKMTTTTSVTTTSAPPSSATPAPLPIQLYAPDCVLFDDPSALDDFRPRYTRPGPAPPPPMMNGRRRAPRRHDHSNNSQYNLNTSEPSHNHTHIHCNCAAKRSTDPQLIASIQAYIHTLFTLKYTYHDLPHAFFDKVREAEKGLIPLLLRDGVVDVARRRGDLGEAAKKQKSGSAKRQVVVAGKSSQPEKQYSQSKEPTSVAAMHSGDSSRPVMSPPGTSSLSRTGSQESQSSNSTQDTTDSKSLAKSNRASAQQQPGKPSATPTRPDLSLNLKLDDFPTPEMMFDMREEMRDVVGDFLSEIFITTATDISDHIALLADIHGYDSLSCGPPCVCTLSACLPCIINLQFRLINDEPVKPFPRDPPDTALVRWSVKAIRGSMISTEAIIGEPKKLAKAIQKPANDTSRASKSANGKDDAPYVPIEEIMRQIDASDERDRLQLEEAQRRMGDELWRIALEMDLEVLAKREIRALKEVPDDEFVTLLNEACSPNPEDEHEEEHRLIDLWEEWTGHIPSIDPDHTHSEEKDYLEAEKEKKSGNHAFTRGLYRRALRHFTRAIELVSTK